MVGELARTNEEVVRIAGLLRGVESAVQAVSVSPSSCIWRLDSDSHSMVSIAFRFLLPLAGCI